MDSPAPSAQARGSSRTRATPPASRSPGPCSQLDRSRAEPFQCWSGTIQSERGTGAERNSAVNREVRVPLSSDQILFALTVGGYPLLNTFCWCWRERSRRKTLRELQQGQRKTLLALERERKRPPRRRRRPSRHPPQPPPPAPLPGPRSTRTRTTRIAGRRPGEPSPSAQPRPPPSIRPRVPCLPC
jgi:hypothetical protein